ncbi:uncharacterized protein LOC133204107 [Saccostrea echinata]|uniref:uncharacterized protein LOC133204107 n=1 Tax=Saccostrea echinata TaxID=191078 RepID=UPI002A823CB2|nr:uncharacterized protein LOC133204107 [Saccostrea echinata]
MMIFYLGDLSLVYLFKMISEVYSRKCLASLPTINYIKKCPDTREEWNNAAKLKGCENIKQNCTSKEEKLKYHCVINSFGNATLDVCAPTWYIAGYCTEFNEEGLLIQDHYAKDCTNFDNTCPTRYLSTDAYKYQECYKLATKAAKENHLGQMDALTIGETVMGILVGILFATFICCIVMRYRRNWRAKKKLKMLNNDHAASQINMGRHEADQRRQCNNTRLINELRQRIQEDTDVITYETINYADVISDSSNNYSSV